MRTAVAMADHHTPDWLGPALGAAGTVVAGWLAWLGVRFNAKANQPDPQAEINEGFTDLLGQVRLDLAEAKAERNVLKTELARERRERETEREAFRGEIAQLRAVAEGFERLLRRNGITIPERKAHPGQPDPTHEPVKIVETTLRQDGADGLED